MQSHTGELEYRSVTVETLPVLIETYYQVWPQKTLYHDCLEKPFHPEDVTNVSWLIYHHGDLVGIVGVYSFDPDESGYDSGRSIWMDHFAILPKFRRQGFGRQVIHDVINYCQNLKKPKYFRLDTVYYSGRPALALYDQVMTLREDYTAEDTLDKCQHYLIYSYSLDGPPIQPWNNQRLDLGDSDHDLIIK